jgi:DNA-binding response OmpR family regulator
MSTVLVVEDDPRIVSFLVRGLAAEGYDTEVAGDGMTAASVLVSDASRFAVVLLDLGLPGTSGEEVLQLLRARDASVPVIVLTARDTVADKVTGLDLGANDYVTKPFSFAELLARIRAAIRSTGPAMATELVVGELRLDLVGKVAWRGGRRIDLSQREVALLELFMRHAGRVLARSRILAEVWQYGFATESNVVDVYVGYLRRKLDRPGLPPAIETVRGVGYRLVNA